MLQYICISIPGYIITSKAAKHPYFAAFSRGENRIWRRGRDSNPRVIAHKLISSQPRYDRFDTSAYILN